MDVRLSYEGLSFQHTPAETPDPDCHLWQDVAEADELIVHAANLHLFRTTEATPSGTRLWSLARKRGAPLPQDQLRPVTQ